MAQNFKGDDLELKMQDVVNPLLDQTDVALNEFYNTGYQSSQFLLMLYDDKRMPFSQTINRDAFIPFFNRAIENFPFIGTFESYLFILRELFGTDAEFLFEVDFGTLDIAILSYSEVTVEAIVREISGSSYALFNLATSEGDDIVFRGLPGIQNEYELNLLFSEIIPAGIYPTFSLNFLNKYFWIAEESSVFYDMVDHESNQIIFIESGG